MISHWIRHEKDGDGDGVKMKVDVSALVVFGAFPLRAGSEITSSSLMQGGSREAALKEKKVETKPVDVPSERQHTSSITKICKCRHRVARVVTSKASERGSYIRQPCWKVAVCNVVMQCQIAHCMTSWPKSDQLQGDVLAHTV